MKTADITPKTADKSHPPKHINNYTKEGVCMDVLSGVKVLDLTRLLPGPYCTSLMADYGDYIRWRTPMSLANRIK